jgi:hypothetical protein
MNLSRCASPRDHEPLDISNSSSQPGATLEDVFLEKNGGINGCLKIIANGTVMFKYTSENKGKVRRHPRIFQIKGTGDTASLNWKVTLWQGMSTQKCRSVSLKDITRLRFGSEIHSDHPACGSKEQARSISISHRVTSASPEQTIIHLCCKTDEDFYVWKAGMQELMAQLGARPPLPLGGIARFQAVVRGAQVRSIRRLQSLPGKAASSSAGASPLWMSYSAPQQQPPLVSARRNAGAWSPYSHLVVTGADAISGPHCARRAPCEPPTPHPRPRACARNEQPPCGSTAGPLASPPLARAAARPHSPAEARRAPHPCAARAAPPAPSRRTLDARGGHGGGGACARGAQCWRRTACRCRRRRKGSPRRPGRRPTAP